MTEHVAGFPMPVAVAVLAALRSGCKVEASPASPLMSVCKLRVEIYKHPMNIHEDDGPSLDLLLAMAGFRADSWGVYWHWHGSPQVIR